MQGSGCRKQYLGMADVEGWKSVIQDRSHQQLQEACQSNSRLVDERALVTGEVRPQAAPPPQSHTHSGPVLLQTEATDRAGSCWPPGVRLAETIHRLKIQLELKRFPK